MKQSILDQIQDANVVPTEPYLLDMESLAHHTTDEELDMESFASGWKKFRDGFKDAFRGLERGLDDYEKRFTGIEFSKEVSKFALITKVGRSATVEDHFKILNGIEGGLKDMMIYSDVLARAIKALGSNPLTVYKELSGLEKVEFLKSGSAGDMVELAPTIQVHFEERYSDDGMLLTRPLPAPSGSFMNTTSSSDKVKGTYDEQFFNDTVKAYRLLIPSIRKYIDSYISSVEDLIALTDGRISGGGETRLLTTMCLNLNSAAYGYTHLLRSGIANLEDMA